MIKLDYNNMMEDFIKGGVLKSDLTTAGEIGKKAHEDLQKRRETDLGFMNLPYNQTEIVEEILAYREEMKDIEAFVLFGIGGSALGPMAVQQALNTPHYNELTREERGGLPKLYIVDNVDPERLSYLFEVINPEKCLFNVISKSGTTSETMSQFMIIKELLREKMGDNFKRNIVCTTDKENGNLIKIAKNEGYKTFYIPDNVGGRFSELTPVGLLPAAFCGIDIKKMLEGAASMDKICLSDEISKNPALTFAALAYITIKNDKNIQIVMPYADSLKYIADWYAQLWAESIGKKYDREGNIVHVGSTPVKALGVTDQHSQLQLYSEGPNDKIIIFLGAENYKKEITIPKIYEEIPSLSFLGGHTHSKLIKTEQLATEYALLKSGKQNMTITLEKVDEYSIGALLYLFELATAYAGEFLNINAFDQPGVEESKNATYALFDRPGYEEKKEEILNAPQKKKEYVI